MGGLARADLRAWDAFWLRWEKLAGEFPKAKRLALQAAAMSVYRELLSQIDRRVSDPRGRVKRWQDVRFGSGGGYAAITAKPLKDGGETVQVTKTGKKTSSIAVTRYLEKGHPARTPSGRDKRYRGRLAGESRLAGGTGMLIVPGRQFYSFTKLHAGDEARKAADKTLQKLKAAIEKGEALC